MSACKSFDTCVYTGDTRYATNQNILIVTIYRYVFLVTIQSDIFGPSNYLEMCLKTFHEVYKISSLRLLQKMESTYVCHLTRIVHLRWYMWCADETNDIASVSYASMVGGAPSAVESDRLPPQTDVAPPSLLPVTDMMYEVDVQKCYHNPVWITVHVNI